MLNLYLQSLPKVKLGCPVLCDGWDCIDVRGTPSREVYAWLEAMVGLRRKVSRIESNNLLEHLPDPKIFLSRCRLILAEGGEIELTTDNAEFFPFYLPFWIRRSGIGAHSKNQYALDHCNSVHYMIFTKMHLENLFRDSGFENVKVKRIKYGARLKVLAW